MSNGSGGITYPDPGPPAELVWLDIDLLAVDDRYQRDASGNKSQRHIRKIAQNFAWAWFQPPTVVRRPDGGYVVVDGQHRVEAARLHPAIDRIPCSVVTLADPAAEAATFIAINGARMTVHAKHLLKARLAAGDDEASEIMRVCEAAGVQIAGNGRLGGLLPGWTQAAGKIETCIRRYNACCVIEALLALKAAAGTRTNQLGAVAIGAACRLIYDLEDGWDRGRFARAVGARPVEDWIHEARPFAFGMGGLDKAVAAAWRTAFDAAEPSAPALALPADRPAATLSPFSPAAVAAAPSVAQLEQPRHKLEEITSKPNKTSALDRKSGPKEINNKQGMPAPPEPAGFANPRLAAIAAEPVTPRAIVPVDEPYRQVVSKQPAPYVPPRVSAAVPTPAAPTADGPSAPDAASHPNLARTAVEPPPPVARRAASGSPRGPAAAAPAAAPRRRGPLILPGDVLDKETRRWAARMRGEILRLGSFAVFEDVPASVIACETLPGEMPNPAEYRVGAGASNIYEVGAR